MWIVSSSTVRLQFVLGVGVKAGRVAGNNPTGYRHSTLAKFSELLESLPLNGRKMPS